MATTKRSTVVGVFTDRTQAQRAVAELRQVGFREDEIGVITRDEHGHGTEATSGKGSKVAAGAATGVAAGAGVGALWALGIAAGMLPAIGPVIAGGLLASVLASAAGGAVIAGIAGALIGLGIPEEEAKYYESEVHAGRTLVTVKAGARNDEAVGILRRFGAYDMHTAPGGTTTTAKRGTEHATAHTETGKTVQVREEHLHARKTPVEKGEVRVRKEVVTENQTLEVPVTREEVVIERHPASGKASSADIRAGEEIRIPVKEEQVHVEKQAVVKEEVSVGKRKVTDTERVSGTVKKEQVKVDREGDVKVDTTDATKKTPRKK
jgi:uncharacterized protein (TIGR02271 family)